MQKLLLESYTGVAWIRQADGGLPLHLAARSGCSKDILKLLLILNPCDVSAVDCETFTPLHNLFDARYSRHNYSENGISSSRGHVCVTDFLKLCVQAYFDYIPTTKEKYRKCPQAAQLKVI